MGAQGAYDPEIQTQSRFLYNAPTHQVPSSYVLSFGSYRVYKQTNKQTHKQTSTSLRYAVPMDNDNDCISKLAAKSWIDEYKTGLYNTSKSTKSQW